MYRVILISHGVATFMPAESFEEAWFWLDEFGRGSEIEWAWIDWHEPGQPLPEVPEPEHVIPELEFVL